MTLVKTQDSRWWLCSSRGSGFWTLIWNQRQRLWAANEVMPRLNQTRKACLLLHFLITLSATVIALQKPKSLSAASTEYLPFHEIYVHHQ